VRGRAEAEPEGLPLAGEGGGQACALLGFAWACQEGHSTWQGSGCSPAGSRADVPVSLAMVFHTVVSNILTITLQRFSKIRLFLQQQPLRAV